MSQSAKTSFGRYEIIHLLGVGGMGEVYLAQDKMLDRQVAIKFLAEKFSTDADRLNRFVQEAKSASALNHPNILTVYEIGQTDDKHFIATEFIDGKTLNRYFAEEKLPLQIILDIAVQIASALQAAHQAGIVHRDIKPDNIMIREDGIVKLLDFGLVKLTEKPDEPVLEADAATIAKVMTAPGIVMGTPQYMSPEQARGKETDARSDIWSVGVVLYEILSGCVPFQGETMNDVIAAIIHKEIPPLTRFVPNCPPELERIVMKSLQKNRDERYQTIKDFVIDLKSFKRRLAFEVELERNATFDKNTFGTSPTLNIPFSSSVTKRSGSNKDYLLLTEFKNLTGDAVFDDTLKMALTVALEQSPFLQIFPDAKVRQTLSLMEHPRDEIVTREIGREICLRQGLKVFVAGTIASFGTIYVLTLEAVNAQTGESLGRQFEQAESKEQVLKVLGHAASGLREKLGESLSSIEQFDAVDEYTTSSLEALKVYTLARQMEDKGKTFDAIPFYKKAVEIDPNFATAYTGLAVIYSNTGQLKLSAEYAAKAFELRSTVSEYEKLRIAFFYYNCVTGETDKIIEILELWKQTYPRHPHTFTNLSDCYERIGQPEKAVRVIREGLQVHSGNAVTYMNLAESLLSLSCFEEVEDICQKAFERKYDGDYFHLFLYQTAYIKNDATAMNEHLAWFEGRPDEYLALNLQIGTAAFEGKWRTTQSFARQAIELANHSGAREIAAEYTAEQALRIVFWSSAEGLPQSDEQLKFALKTQIRKALELERNKVTLTYSALALAIAGQVSNAENLIEELKAEYPQDTLINGLWLPTINAALKLQTGVAKAAVKELETAEKYEKAAEFYPQYLRGLAYLQLKQYKKAEAEFQKILDNRGESPLSVLYPLAQLGKARAAKDKSDYEKFFEMWKDADKDMPALVQAKKEFTKYQ